MNVPEALPLSLEDYLEGGIRPRIIDAAATLFRQRGFNAVSMIEVAQAVGLSKPGLYHHWPNKEALLLSIVGITSALLLQQLEDVKAATNDPAQRMRLFMRSRIEVVARYQNLFTVTWQERAILGSGSYRTLAATAERYRDSVRSLIDEAKDAGSIRQEVDTHLLMLAIDGMTGWAYFWYREQGALRPAAIGDAFWDMLLGGIADGTHQAIK
ncbi:transcriptional regulator, TetR family [Paracoccus aminovorans]|uniref:Transcriptional regulator, TetR family n=1 Tax=Paracoccus aminovorans TaxID=34004 RepID=A0A1I3B4N3_9RHOB|nr:TetR/AcrR family transcriptional regulator [Paracoccus aminovorans]CQR87563.1 TetR/AcrR family transcriptional regulator [Paracoccus aminovorans]SFH56919.1 transcriptional regulator, TetR family [Paracoccus aminovorans]